MEKALHLLNKHREGVLNLPNVVGVGLGYKIREGEITNEPAIVTLVLHKVPEAYLPQSCIVPAEFDGMLTDVRAVGEICLLAHSGKTRPAQPGFSIGHYKITAGTFGTVVYDQDTGEPLILSNNHVLANATNGSDGRSAIGDPIYQPGVYDGGTAEDTIAHLKNFSPIKFSSSANNKVDAAVAKPISADLITANIVDIGTVNGIAEATIDLAVKKSGRTSELTNDTIQTINTTVKVNMGDGRIAIFVDQIVAGAMSQPGDSGSLVVTEDNKAVGLLFAGSTYTTVINPIANVLSALNIRF